ncbi:hypothetical protein EVAR_23430_1 [Eumeta japonica]|uniref:Uncharacterized protein n=1 Tax=Eumeta variegata TaxID=151549 RepID=A0A4C1UKI4_EUMVA|nr:hypothetical protein EVAR_23430_1 [Eumeta japonica]
MKTTRGVIKNETLRIKGRVIDFKLKLEGKTLNEDTESSFDPRSVVSGSARVRVCGVPRSVSHATAVKPRASVPATSSGYLAVCTPSPHTVSAPREHSRSFRTLDTDRYFSYFACFYARKWFFH